MIPITPGTWFKGTTQHAGDDRTFWFESPPDWLDPNRPDRHCLLLACESLIETKQVAAIITTLFPERACGCDIAAYQVVHFNNHPDTTRDEVDKILHTYALEHGGTRE